jgi:hypothetical protein
MAMDPIIQFRTHILRCSNLTLSSSIVHKVRKQELIYFPWHKSHHHNIFFSGKYRNTLFFVKHGRYMHPLANSTYEHLQKTGSICLKIHKVTTTTSLST